MKRALPPPPPPCPFLVMLVEIFKLLAKCVYVYIFFRNKPAYTQKDVVYQFAKLFSVQFTGFNYKVRVTDENVASSFKVVFLIPDWIRTFDHI